MSPAKINLSLKVTGKNKNGYHNLEMTLCPIDIFDRILLKRVPGSFGKIEVSCNRQELSGRKNIAFLAASYYQTKTSIRESVSIDIEKKIPIGAGLGGGSSNAASVIKGLEHLFEKKLPPGGSKEIALSLGADVPFFLVGGTAFVTGIGEIIRETPLTKPLYLVLIYPDLILSTSRVFADYDKYSNNPALTWVTADDKSFKQNFDGFFCSCIDGYLLRNDLQQVAIKCEESIKYYLEMLTEHGASHAMMSGSGSSVFGIFENRKKQREAFRTLQGILDAKSKLSGKTPDVTPEETISGRPELFMAQTLALEKTT